MYTLYTSIHICPRHIVCMHAYACIYIYISLSLSPCVCVSVCLRVPPSISGGWGWSPLLSSGSCKQVYQMGNTPSRERVGMRLAPKNFLEKSPLPQLNHVLPEPHEILPPRNTSTKWGVHTKQIQKNWTTVLPRNDTCVILNKMRYQNAGLESTWSMFIIEIWFNLKASL